MYWFGPLLMISAGMMVEEPIVYVQGIIGEEQFFFGDSSKFQDTAAVFVHIPLHLLYVCNYLFVFLAFKDILQLEKGF